MTQGSVGEIRNKKSRTTFLDPEMLEVTPNTIVPLKLDFAAQKKGHGRLGRVETGLLCSHPTHRNQGARQRTQAGRTVPLS